MGVRDGVDRWHIRQNPCGAPDSSIDWCLLVNATAKTCQNQAGIVLGRASQSTIMGSVGVAMRLAPGLTLVLVAVLLVQLGMIAGAAFLPLRLVALGGQPSDVALLTGLGAAAEIPAMLASGAIVARLGLRGLFAGSAVIYAA